MGEEVITTEEQVLRFVPASKSAADTRGCHPAPICLFGPGQRLYIRPLTNDGKMGFDRSAAYQHEIHHYSCSEGPIKAKKKVLSVFCRFSAVTGLIYPDYFTAKPDRRDKGQKKGSAGKRKHSQRVNVSSGACITL